MIRMNGEFNTMPDASMEFLRVVRPMFRLYSHESIIALAYKFKPRRQKSQQGFFKFVM